MQKQKPPASDAVVILRAVILVSSHNRHKSRCKTQTPASVFVTTTTRNLCPESKAEDSAVFNSWETGKQDTSFFLIGTRQYFCSLVLNSKRTLALIPYRHMWWSRVSRKFMVVTIFKQKSRAKCAVLYTGSGEHSIQCPWRHEFLWHSSLQYTTALHPPQICFCGK